MAFEVSDDHLREYHVHEYHVQGCTVFRGILPPALIADLRRAADRGRELARERGGPRAQRFQPVAAYDVPQQPFAAYRNLPALGEAMAAVLGFDPEFGNPGLIGVLIEPECEPWCTRWHRDWRDNHAYLDLAEWQSVFGDIRYFNQSNCALYEDHSLWIVPGSHLRGDLPREAALFPDRPIREPELAGRTVVEREREVLGYVRAMPGAVPVHLDAGDFALYRNTLWHLGCYVPYCKRATLHDFVDTPEFRTWRERMKDDTARRKEAGLEWEWNRRWAAARA